MREPPAACQSKLTNKRQQSGQKKIKEKTRGGENVQRKTCPMSNIRCWMNSGDASPNHCIPMPPISRQMIMTTVVEGPVVLAWLVVLVTTSARD